MFHGIPNPTTHISASRFKINVHLCQPWGEKKASNIVVPSGNQRQLWVTWKSIQDTERTQDLPEPPKPIL